MKEGFPGEVLEKRHANHALEPPLELLEEVPVGWVSREAGQEEMSFPQRHRRVVGVGPVRPGRGQDAEIFGNSEADWYMSTKNPGSVALGNWGFGPPLPFFLLDMSMILLHPLLILPLTPLLQLTSYFLLRAVSAQRPPPPK